MTSLRWSRKMSRNIVRLTKLLVTGVVVICVSWIASVNEWHGGVRWGERPGRAAGLGAGPAGTMRTIVAYSERKQAELDRPSPVSCDSLPAFPPLTHTDRQWTPGSTPPASSWQHVPNSNVSLYAAYYDERLPQRYIRILGSFPGHNFPSEDTLYCQTRPINSYENNLEVVAARPKEIWNKVWNPNSLNVQNAVLLSCPLTEPLSGPSVVSLVTEPCENPTNAFSITPSQDKQYTRNFTICVKDMNFAKDISRNIIEWIEINKILGVDMIDFYIDNITKKSENVLLHYRDKGYVRLFHVPIKDTRKPSRGLWQRRRDHLISYNDCLYRNIHDSEYIIPLDIDEIILPKIAHTWSELIKRLKQYHNWNTSQNSAILVTNKFFYDFMQGIQNYKFRGNKSDNGSVIYAKRDDVRIKKIEGFYINEIELVGSVESSNNEVVDSDEIRYYEKFKKRCGKEMPTPKLVKNIVSSATVSPIRQFTKALMVTKEVLTAFNHYPLADIGVRKVRSWPAPFSEVQLNHYKESCEKWLGVDCVGYGRRAKIDRSALRLRSKLVRALSTSPCAGINTT